MGPCAGVDYNLTFCPLQSRLQQFYHGLPYARADLNLMPESTLSPQSETMHGFWPLSCERSADKELEYLILFFELTECLLCVSPTSPSMSRLVSDIPIIPTERGGGFSCPKDKLDTGGQPHLTMPFMS
jgi:hypothetical protein